MIGLVCLSLAIERHDLERNVAANNSAHAVDELTVCTSGCRACDDDSAVVRGARLFGQGRAGGVRRADREWTSDVFDCHDFISRELIAAS